MSNTELKQAIREDVGFLWYLFGRGIDVSEANETELNDIHKKFIHWNNCDSIAVALKEFEDL